MCRPSGSSGLTSRSPVKRLWAGSERTASSMENVHQLASCVCSSIAPMLLGDRLVDLLAGLEPTNVKPSGSSHEQRNHRHLCPPPPRSAHLGHRPLQFPLHVLHAEI